MATTKARELPYRLRRSRIHGTGAFATRPIRKGARVDEYVGERISHAEADRRYAEKEEGDGHTFLFTVDKKIVIDAGVGGGPSRFINHSCDPNCEVWVDSGRVFIGAKRAIQPGEELNYDYNIGRSPEDPPNVEEIFACRCGSPKCRGSMLAPVKKKRAAASKSKSKSKSTATKKTKSKATKTKAKTKAKAKKRA